MRPTYPLFILLGLLPACGDSAGNDDATAGETTGDTSTGDTPTTGAGDLNERELGASATPACVAAKTHVAALFTAATAGDAAAASAAYTGTALQTYVQQLDTLGERSDDADIGAWLTAGDASSLAAAAARVQVAYAVHLRANLNAVDTGAADKYAAWDEARNIRVEVICARAQAETLLAHLQVRYFANYAMVAYLSEVEVLRPGKF